MRTVRARVCVAVNGNIRNFRSFWGDCLDLKSLDFSLRQVLGIAKICCYSSHMFTSQASSFQMWLIKLRDKLEELSSQAESKLSFS